MQVFCTDELYHHGIKGQRWGIRRYQNPDGTLTAAGKRRYGTAENLERGMTIKQRAKYDAEKAQALRSGSAADVLKFKGDITDAEYRSVEERLRHERAIMDAAVQEADVSYNKNKQKVDRFINTATQVKNIVGLATDIYNAGAKIYNSTNPEGKTIAVIGEKNPFKSAKEKEADKIADYGDYETVMRNKDKLNPEQMKRASDRLTNYKKVVDADYQVRKKEQDVAKDKAKEEAKAKEEHMEERKKSLERQKLTSKMFKEPVSNRFVSEKYSNDVNKSVNAYEQKKENSRQERVSRMFKDLKDVSLGNAFVSNKFQDDINESIFMGNSPVMHLSVDDVPPVTNFPLLPEHKSK